jgi:hypothetical protein
MRSIPLYTAALILLWALPAISQDREVEKDVESWVSVKATKRFDFDLDVSLEQQVRFLKYQQTFTEIGLKYTALGFLDIGSEMRFKFLSGGRTEYRLAAFLGVEAEKKDFEAGFRFKVTSNYSRFDDPFVVLRNKMDFKYTIRKDWRIGTELELFLPREDDIFWLGRYRWAIELRYKFTKMHLLTIFYGIERDNDLDEDDPVVLRHLFGTRYDIRW